MCAGAGVWVVKWQKPYMHKKDSAALEQEGETEEDDDDEDGDFGEDGEVAVGQLQGS